MVQDLNVLCLGAAVAVDTALLLGVFERDNFRRVALPILMLLIGVWLFHSGEFVNRLVVQADGAMADTLRWSAMTTMSAGLLLLPSSMLHSVMRIRRTGFQVPVPAWWGHGWSYAPLAMWPLAVYGISAHPDVPFLRRVAPLIGPYAVLACTVNVAAAVAFLLHARTLPEGDLRRFLTRLAMLLLLISALLGFAVGVAGMATRDGSSWLVLAVTLSPLAPSLLFAYYVLRFRFMQLVLARSFLYGTLCAALVLFHQVVIQNVTQQLHERYRINVGILEGLVILLAMVAYRPVGRRVREALQYLFAYGTREIRERTRQVAVAMWDHLEDEPQPLIDWFVSALRESFSVMHAAGWLFDQQGQTFVRSGDLVRFQEPDAQALHRALPPHSYISMEEGSAVQPQALDALRQMRASLAVRVDHAGFSGLLVLGRRSRAREFGEEETNAVLLLVELLGATLHSHHLQVQRRDAERAAAQHEKLSTLGMLTSCLAHEIKNPLSSIKTLATVLAEQIGDSHPHGEDIRLIRKEAERLSTTTGQFLRFARPASADAGPTSLSDVIAGAVQVLSCRLRSAGVALETVCAPDTALVQADENAVREIVFNLLVNALEAVGERPGGRVRVSVHRDGPAVELLVEDNGPGIMPELRERIFSPFVTTKPEGTGLGLYIVRRQVEQLGGEISVGNTPGGPTCFRVKLPAATEPKP
ncbi:MAG: sensor histidine kinase [Pirellulaceae bacterium]